MLKQVLIIQTASLGDVILSTALAESLHNLYPDLQLDYLIKNGYQGLFAGHPFIRKVYTFDKSKGKYRNLFQLISEFRKTGYDAVINVQRFASSGLITALSGAPHRCGFDKNPFSFAFNHKCRHIISHKSPAGHEITRNFGLISWIQGIGQAKPVLYPDPQNAGSDIKELFNNQYITISPSSLWFTKQYPAEKWIEFIQALPSGIRVVLLGGKDDRELCETIRTRSGTRNMKVLAGELNFLMSAHVMKGAVMNFVNDSAPMHLASSVNAPVTAVFCSTVPEFGFGPLSDNASVVETRHSLSCRPCGLHGHRQCPEKHFSCALSIERKQLLDRLDL